ncbi:MAG: argininosuccinate lyase [Leptospiraceae bacterium]|nr:argininosuccinate lyase [Leptospiraceae bacterium]MDW7975021.1 argininosuccinate lyase [Leptospiraceae bacterium]
MSTKETLWKGRSEGKLHPLLIKIGESISLDIKLYREDLKGSYAHAKMLKNIGLLSDEEAHQILDGLKKIQKEIENQEFPLFPELEDIHTHVENRLKELIGPIAGKLHTARSRNDQIAVDTHLFVKKVSFEILNSLYRLCEVIVSRSEELMDVIMPSYTHLQVAQPVRMSHYLMSYFWMFLRDIERMMFAYQQADRLPLGVGAVAGVNYENDREFLRKELGFSDFYENSMDAVSSRDHIFNLLYAVAMISLHLSRLCEELILYSSVEFNFLEFPDELTTGSSLMPQKKNLDLAELIRAKSGRLISNLNTLMIVMKALPLTYNRDLQEDRKPLLESEEVIDLIEATILLISHFKVKEKNLENSLHQGFATATDLADALVVEGNLPFREAHHIVGMLVRICVEKSYHLGNIPKEIRSQIHPLLGNDEFYFRAIDLKLSTEKKKSRGGTSLSRVKEQIQLAKKRLTEIKSQLPEKPNLDLD